MISTILHLSEGLAVRALVAGQGTPVLLIHGVGLCAEAWAPQFDAFAADHRVIAVDMPGHGASDRLPGTPVLADFVAWAAQVIMALDCGPVAVVGHSMGALIATGLAVEHPQLVSCAALLNPVYQRSAAARAAVMERAAQIAAADFDPEAPLDRWFDPEEGELRMLTSQWLRQNSPEGYGAAYRAFAAGDSVYAGRIAQISCPLLALTGANDLNSTPAMATALADAAPFGRAVIIDGHRHMVHLTAPDVVSQELRNWLVPAEVSS
ncbi:alpha/beta fold hydrolase [Roseinatronobacter sp. NSM]|uniref:alpha/beta fold hydrolase n=1 Tax=Roseinatronobacter sp. NSM TaxID=3457785 RepID=UPI004035667F